jgi:Flp pilus assembly protein TadG
MRIARRFSLTTCRRGASAVEFALVAPLIFMVMVGTLYAGLLVFSVVGLQNSVEAAARCYSVNSSLCGTSAAAQNYALQQYYGVSTPTFVASTAACGHQVSATLTVEFNAVVTNVSVPVAASACFP